VVINVSSGSSADEYFDSFPPLKPKDLAIGGRFLWRRITQLSRCVCADAQLTSANRLIVHTISVFILVHYRRSSLLKQRVTSVKGLSTYITYHMNDGETMPPRISLRTPGAPAGIQIARR
jgi:hypothetical protein